VDGREHHAGRRRHHRHHAARRHDLPRRQPVTADDVKFTFDYYVEQDFGYFRAFLSRIASVEVTGPLSVRFNLSEPVARSSP
jgi:ABC-type transport system substrate-binding protein